MSTTDPILDRIKKLPVKVQRDEYRAIIEQGVEEGLIPPSDRDRRFTAIDAGVYDTDTFGFMLMLLDYCEDLSAAIALVGRRRSRLAKSGGYYTILYTEGPECPVCGRPRLWRVTRAGFVCGTGEDSGRLMDPEDPCWTCRDSDDDDAGSDAL